MEEKSITNGEWIINEISEAIRVEAQMIQDPRWTLDWTGDWTDYNPWAGQNG